MIQKFYFILFNPKILTVNVGVYYNLYNIVYDYNNRNLNIAYPQFYNTHLYYTL